MYNKLIILYFLGFISFSWIQSDEFKADLIKVTRTYRELDQFTAHVEVKGFNENGSLVYDLDSEMKMKGENMYHRNAIYEYLKNEDFVILVMLEDKEIYFRKSEQIQESVSVIEWMNSYEMLLDTVMSIYSKIEYHGIKNGIKHYAIHNPNHYIIKTDLFIDVNLNLLKNVILQYSEEYESLVSQVVINYNKINLKPHLADGFFDESRFIQFKGENFKPSGQYQDFRIFNNSEIINP